MRVTLRLPAGSSEIRARWDGDDVEFAAMPREGETVEIEGESWFVGTVVHYPKRLTDPEDLAPPYVILKEVRLR